MAESHYHDRAIALAEPRWLPENTGWGSFRAVYERISVGNLSANLVRMPGGQRSPWHGSGGWPELGEPFAPLGEGGIFFGMTGTVAFDTLGRTFLLRPRDMLLVNAAVYSYFNAGTKDAFFWVLRGRGERHPVALNAPASEADLWQGDPLAARMVGSHPYYDSEPLHVRDILPDADARVSLAAWSNYKRSPIEWSGAWGSTVGRYPHVEVGFSAQMLRWLPGQSCEPQVAATDTMLFGVRGKSLRVAIDGASHKLRRYDAITLVSGATYRYTNLGSGAALSLALGAKQ